MDDLKTLDRISPSEYELFVGMDVDKRGISVAVFGSDEKLLGRRFPYEGGQVVDFVEKRFAGPRVVFAYESGPTGYGLFDVITDRGYPCLVVTPSLVPEKRLERNKTNRLDAEKLAKGLRSGDMHGVRVPSDPYRHLRNLVHLRRVEVKQIRACKTRIKSLLLEKGLPFPAASSFTKAAIEELRTSARYDAFRFLLDVSLDDLAHHLRAAVRVMQETRDFLASHPEMEEYVDLLTTLPGIGWITATVILARIGDPARLRKCDELGAFFGLTPWERSTGDHTNLGRVTGMGDAHARSLLIECSWVAIRVDQELRNFHWRVRRRHPKNRASQVAIVATARKLTKRIFAVLKERRPYEVRDPELRTVR